jgi:hypothetical protein
MDKQLAASLADKYTSAQITEMMGVVRGDESINWDAKCKTNMSSTKIEIYELFIAVIEAHEYPHIEMCAEWKLDMLYEFGEE